MKKVLTLSLFLSILIGIRAQEDTTRVLFVGNSFTYFYNLPQVVSAMGASQNVILESRQSTVGGSTLEHHWNEERGTVTKQKIKDGHWDYIVFNNHSMSTISRPDSFMEYSRKFAEYSRAHGAEPIFMMTWGYKSNPLMIDHISNKYQQLGEETKADIIPCGLIIDKTRKWRPDLELFFDDKHPSYIGTYLLGLTFFKYFTRTSTENIPDRLTTTDHNGEKLYLMFMHSEDSKFLKDLVDRYEFQTN